MVESVAVLSIRRLRKVFAGGVEAVRRFDLEVSDGETVALFGPNGSGKTTVLRLVAGLEAPSEGDVWIDDREVTGWPPRHRHVAYVPQGPALLPHLTIAENLAFGSRYADWKTRRGVTRGCDSFNGSEIDARVKQVAEQFGLAGLAERFPDELSFGQQRRASLARAWFKPASVALLDEPLANLDRASREPIERNWNQLRRTLQRTCLYVTHDPYEALAVADRICVMRSGAVEQLGPPQEILDRPATRFVAEVVGTPTMNFCETVWDEAARMWQNAWGTWPADEVGVAGSARSDRPALGIRPQDVLIQKNQQATPGHSREKETDGIQRENAAHPATDGKEVPRAAVRGRVVDLRRGESAWWVEMVPPCVDPSAARLVGLVPEPCAPGDEVVATWRWDRVHWFDADGRRCFSLRS